MHEAIGLQPVLLEVAASKSSLGPNRLAHRHQQSPGRTPGKLYSGMAWCSGLPTAAETARNFSVASMHTVCRPSSCGPVLQKPSR